MSKYYRVKKDTFMWEKGAILKRDKNQGSEGGYEAINDLWDKVELHGEYISSRIIEDQDNEDFFERVYPIGDLKKMIFGTKIQAKAAASALFEEGEKK